MGMAFSVEPRAIRACCDRGYENLSSVAVYFEALEHQGGVTHQV